MTKLIKILKISLEEQLLIKYCVIKPLMLQRIQIMMDLNVGLLQWSIVFFMKDSVGAFKNENMSNKRLAEELH